MAEQFFVAGGTLAPDVPSYVTRPADEELYQHILAGEFCYVLTSRQMGKSSLMVRTAKRLQESGQVKPIIIDLTKSGTAQVTPEQWYLMLVKQIANGLRLKTNPLTWWQENQVLDPVTRFSDFLREVVLTELTASIVIFIDEIDSTLSLDFSVDDFFAAIRAVHNARATDEAYKRLTFVLVGVASPSDLIKDNKRTPFNIGKGVILTDFDPTNATVLQSGLSDLATADSAAILARVYYWTNGHPYLTQKLCQEVFTAKNVNSQAVDEVVERLFFSEQARKETNLQFVRDRLMHDAQKRKLLLLYRDIYRDKQVRDDERSLAQNQLKLTGLVKANQGQLQVRNEIYRRVFNAAWLKENTPPAPWQRPVVILSLVVMLLLGVSGYLLYQQLNQPANVLADTYIKDFKETTDPTLRLNNLAKLISLNESPYRQKAQTLFLNLPPAEQADLFDKTNLPDQAKQLIPLVYPQIYNRLLDTPANNRLLIGIQQYTPVTQTMELENWLQGRKYLTHSQYIEAEEAYDMAINFDKKNSTANADTSKQLPEGQDKAPKMEANALLYVERGIARLKQKKYGEATADFNQAKTLDWSASGLVQYTARQFFSPPELANLTLSSEWANLIKPLPPLTLTQPATTTMLLIPGGPFIMGENADIGLAECKKLYYQPEQCQRSLFENEEPSYTVILPDFYIDKYEVTNAQYAECVSAGKCTAPVDKKSFTQNSYYGNAEYNNYPVIYVDWSQAKGYCAWRGGRLPTEAEWEKSARGTDGRQYSWGNEFNGTKVNFCDKNCTFDWANKNYDDGYADTAPVGSYPQGASPYGVHDMAGNVWEWVSSEYRPYPYRDNDGREDLTNVKNVKVLRGGSWNNNGNNVRAMNRDSPGTGNRYNDIGFRCVVRR